MVNPELPRAPEQGGRGAGEQRSRGAREKIPLILTHPPHLSHLGRKMLSVTALLPGTLRSNGTREISHPGVRMLSVTSTRPHKPSHFGKLGNVQNVENEPLEAMLPTEGQGESEDIAAPTAPETAPEWLKVGSVVRFCSEVEKYVVKAVSSGTQVMVRSLLSGLFTHTYAHRLELANGGTG